MSGHYEESEYVFTDLQDAYVYLRQSDPAIAEAFLESAYDTFEFLAQHPGLGRWRPEFGHEGLRSWRVQGFPRYLIFYRELADKIQIWRVLHGNRDLPRFLGRSRQT